MSITMDIPPLEVAYQTVLLMDTLQTMDIKRHPGMFEYNPILGRHPSDARVLTYMVGGAVFHYGIAKALEERAPSTYRIFEYVTIGFEVTMVAHNYSIGLKTRF